MTGPRRQTEPAPARASLTERRKRLIDRYMVKSPQEEEGGRTGASEPGTRAARFGRARVNGLLRLHAGADIWATLPSRGRLRRARETVGNALGRLRPALRRAAAFGVRRALVHARRSQGIMYLVGAGVAAAGGALIAHAF